MPINPDIVGAIGGNPIKNGTMILNQPRGGYYNGPLAYNYYVWNTPTIATLQNQYSTRFDDVTYYTA